MVIMGGGLPVNRLETLFETLGAAQLPLAEDGPQNSDTTERSGNCNQDGDNVA